LKAIGLKLREAFLARDPETVEAILKSSLSSKNINKKLPPVKSFTYSLILV
jgi:hypothetical protein